MTVTPQAGQPLDAAGLDALNRMNAGSFDQNFGTEFLEASGDRVRVRVTMGPHLHQPHGIVHGGVYCAIIESVASIGASIWLGDRGRVVGVNNSTDFLRAVSEGQLEAVGEPVHRGRSQQLWRVTITDAQDRLVAQGQVRLQNLTAA